jgi:hypothetical protein
LIMDISCTSTAFKAVACHMVFVASFTGKCKLMQFTWRFDCTCIQV